MNVNSIPAAIRIAFSVLCLAVCLPISAVANPLWGVIQGIERDLGARVGFYMRDLETGEVIAYAADDRFPLNSTFKLLACGALLSRVESGEADLADTARLQDYDIASYSPAIEAHIKAGHENVSFGDACAMMLSVSDNTAANIVLTEIGGPSGLTDILRSSGDQITRLDRLEPELNAAVPGDPRDTTTPRAIAQSVQRLILGDVLSPNARVTLRAWLARHSVADAMFRAALPPDWSIDDRTGAGGYGSRSIVAVIYPPNRGPILASLFITETEASFDRRNAAAAKVGEAIVSYVTNQ